MTTYQYTPILRAKAGEISALHNLTVAAKQRIKPYMQLCSEVPGSFVAKFPAAWQNEVALDGLYNFDRTGSTTTFSGLLTDLRSAGVKANPVVPMNADKRYVKAAAGFVNAANPFVTVRATLSDLRHVGTWVSSSGWSRSNVDLVIVAGQTGGLVVKDFAGYVGHALKGLPTPGAWRSVTLASSAAPKDTSLLQRGRNTVPRDDWTLWSAVAPNVSFDLHFGDYATSHPDLEEPPGVAMGKATVSAKYTIDGEWVILKGHATTGVNGAPMGDQYLQHAKALMKEANFGKIAGCWGDQQIIGIATKATTAGNRTTWAEIAGNRHLSLVADRLP